MNRREIVKLLGLFSVLGATNCGTPGGEGGTVITGKKVVIIGAGISGLAAARYLKQKGFEVIVLEAQNRIGGRIFTDKSLGLPMDMGASWIHGVTGNPITTEANAATATRFTTNDESLIVYDENGSKISDTRLDSYYTSYENLLNQMENLAQESESFDDFVYRTESSFLNDALMKYQFSAYAEFDAGGDIANLSAKYWQNDKIYGGADALFPNGFDAVITHVAKDLDIRLNKPVLAITQLTNSVTIELGNENINADFVLITAPLGVLKSGDIRFIPALSTAKQAAIAQVEVGNVNKILLQFHHKFWDDEQYIGYTGTTKGKFPYFMNLNTFTTNFNGLMTFALGDYGKTIEGQSNAQIQSDVMEILKKIYGSGIPNPMQILVSRWGKEAFSKGSYSFMNAGSINADFTELGKAEGRLFFAGEHTSADYRGTVHGAFLSGLTAAKGIEDF